MSFFNDMLADDAQNVFANPDESGEMVSVITGNVTKMFSAPVFRSPAELMKKFSSGGTPAFTPVLSVFLPFDSQGVNGLASKPDRGGITQVVVAEIWGGPPVGFPIVDILSSDPGGWLVKLK